jgi:hypothetical protein
MKTQREVDALRSELATLDAMLSDLPEDAVLERFGLERRHAELAETLREFDAAGQPARVLGHVALAFDGKPVRGHSSIDAQFAGEGVSEFQKLLSLVAASRSRDEIKGYGRIPDEQYCRLQITGTIEGSFGFLLEEDPEIEPALGETHVAEAIEEANDLLAATAGDDEVFVDTISALETRVRNQLAQFLKVIASNEASLKVTSSGRRTVFRTSEDVQDALDRVNDAKLQEGDDWYDGRLQGYLPTGRRFEFLATDGRLFAGPLAAKLDSALVRPFIDQPCRARVRTTTVLTRGKTRTRHILLDVAPLASADPTAPEAGA